MLMGINQAKNNNFIPMTVEKKSISGVMEREVRKIKDFHSQDEIINSIIVGDSLEIMRRIEPETFDMVFVDPPYNMQLQNELYRPNNTKVDAVDDEWDQFGSFEHYDDFTKAWVKEVKRVMKKNATLWVIGSYHNIFRVGTIYKIWVSGF